MHHSSSSFKPLIKSLELKTYREFDKGENITNKKVTNSYGFSCDVSEADWLDVKKQMQGQ